MRYSRIVAAAAVPLALAGALATTAASSASAAPAAPAVTASAHYQIHHQWQLRGPNQVSLTYKGSTYTYKVLFSQQRGSELLTGTLRDSYLPGTLPVNGVVFGNYVVFSVVYPGAQGVRTFSGSIGKHGMVTGLWTETGSEAGSGQFTLALPAR
jgi:hypothetical protein